MTPGQRENLSTAASEASRLGITARSVSMLMHRAICDPDDDLATLGVCELVLDQMANRLEAIERTLTVMGRNAA